MPEFDPQRLLSRLRFKHLQLLLALHQGGSLRAAAGLMHLTQPALSKALGEVESALATPLFLRHARGLQPTPAGAVAIRGAAMLLSELAHWGEETTQQPGGMVLRIGAPPALAYGYLPGVLGRLVVEAPQLRVQLKEDQVPRLVEALQDGQLDALVTSFPADMPETTSQPLRYEKLFEMDFAVIAPAGHPAVRASDNLWADLARERWILPTRGSMLRRMMDELFRREGVVAPVPVIESSSPFTNLQLVQAGLGISALPSPILEAAPMPDGVRRVCIRSGISAGPVALVSRGPVPNPRLDVLRAALGLTQAAGAAAP